MALNRFAHYRLRGVGNTDTVRVTIVAAMLFLRLAAAGQTSPSFRWIQEVDNSGLAYPWAGLGTDALGNSYVAGSTKSLNFPVKNAMQSHSASPGSFDVFVTKAGPSGNIVYSTYFGGNTALHVHGAIPVQHCGERAEGLESISIVDRMSSSATL